MTLRSGNCVDPQRAHSVPLANTSERDLRPGSMGYVPMRYILKRKAEWHSEKADKRNTMFFSISSVCEKQLSGMIWQPQSDPGSYKKISVK